MDVQHHLDGICPQDWVPQFLSMEEWDLGMVVAAAL